MAREFPCARPAATSTGMDSEPTDEELLRAQRRPGRLRVVLPQACGPGDRVHRPASPGACRRRRPGGDYLRDCRDLGPGLRPWRGAPGAWLLGITARLIAGAQRRRGRELAATARIAGRALIDQGDIERLEERMDAARSSRAVLRRSDPRPRASEALALVGADGLCQARRLRCLASARPLSGCG